MKLATAFVEAIQRHLARIAGRYIAESTLKMVQQRDKGIAKYGGPLEDMQLTTAELIEHAQQEMADGNVYLAALRDAHIRESKMAHAAGVTEVLTVVTATLESIQDKSADIQLAYLKDVLAHYKPFTNSHVLYVQPSQFVDWQATESNLLTLSRRRVFPFGQKVIVTHD